MKGMLWAIAAGAVLAMPADSFAQSGRASGRVEGRVEQRGGRVESGTARGRVDTRRDDRYERRDDRVYGRGIPVDRDRNRWEHDRDRRGNGPAFCRSGAGHPVHGRAWCRDKGWDRDDRRDRDRRWDDDDRWDRDRRWNRVGWGDVIFRRRDRGNDLISGAILRELLGDRVYGRFDDHRRGSGYDGRLDGRWDRYGNGYVLDLRAGGLPLARLIDANRDGRAEIVLLNQR